MDRRTFLGNIAAGGLGLLTVPGLLRADDDNAFGEGSRLFPVPTNTGIRGQVLIVGGGMAGATLAKYLRLWGGTGVNVTLIEKASRYTSNIMSNKVLTGQLPMSQLSYAYSTLVNHYGVSLIQDTVIAIDTAGKQVSRQNGGDISYDRLVLAPGLEFDVMPGMSDQDEYNTLVPHAWQAGPQTELLRNQLLELKAGTRVGDVVITIPTAPFRCPPGPYERACVIADWLRTNHVSSKVVVLDANPDLLVEKNNFLTAFGGAYGYVVDYRSNCEITGIDSYSRKVDFSQGGIAQAAIMAGVLNPIPPQRAPAMLETAGLYDSTPPSNERTVPVNMLSYEATRKPGAGIHVIGDASSTTQPKAGHIGNQQGKTCADAILRILQNKPLNPSPVTNSACYTPITADRATWLSAVYQYEPKSGTMVVPAFHNNGTPIAATSATTGSYKDMQVWFNTLMADTFA